jgi:amino-acid N-acetyltransferase
MADITIRPAQAADAVTMSALIGAYATQNLMLPRSEAQIQRALGDFLVAVDTENDGARIVGCGSLAALSPELAEIRSLAVDADYQGYGLGGLLVGKLIDAAMARGFRQVCALTLRPRFFERQGFTIVDRWNISPKLWQECIYCPKFHHCDEIAVLMDLPAVVEVPAEAPARRNGMLKRLMLAPIRLVML